MYAKRVYFAPSLGSLLLLIATTSLFAQRDEDFASVEAEMLRDIRRGDFGDKTVVYWPLAGDFQDKIIAVGRAERAANRTSQALKLWQFYFRHCKFDPRWPSRWNKAAMEFLVVVQESGEEVRKRYAVDLAAAPTWRALIPVAERVALDLRGPFGDERKRPRPARQREQDRKTVERLTEKLLSSYPKSMFTAPALMMAGDIRSSQSNSKQPVADYYRRGLKRLEEAKAPQRHQIWMLHALSDFFIDRATREEAYKRIARQTDIAAERRYVELQLPGTSIVAFNTKDDMVVRNEREVRRASEEFLTKYPQAFRASTARSRIVNSWLIDGKPEEALRALRRYDHPNYSRLAVDADLLRIARAFPGRGEHDQTEKLLMEFERRFPRSRLRTFQQGMMGDCHEERGDRDKMRASYHKAVAALPKKRYPLRIVDEFSYVASRPFTYLGRHYMRKRQWAKAHAIWKAYSPESTCLNCEVSMLGERRVEMTICEMNQVDFAGGLKIFDRAVKEDGSVSRVIRCQLVESAQRSGKLPFLRRRFGKSPAGAMDFLSPTEGINDYLTWIDQAASGAYQDLWKELGEEPKGHVWDTEPLGWIDLSDDSDDGWKSRRIMHILAACGNDAKPFLIKQAKRTDASHRAALIVLARMKAAEAWPLIQQRWRQAKAQLSEGAAMDYLFAACLLQSDDSIKWVQQLASDGKSRHSTAAREAIEAWDTEQVVWLKPIKRKGR